MDPALESALITAAARAEEARRADAIVVDPYAAKIAGLRGRAALARAGGDRLVGAISVRTRWIDAQLHDGIAGGVRVIVNLGAGMDARPHRLPFARGTTWVELDRPSVLAHKAEHLASPPPRTPVLRVAAELPEAFEDGTLDQALADAGVAPGAPRIWLVEGLLAYLSDERAARLLAGVARRSPPGSVMLADVPNLAAIDGGGAHRVLLKHAASRGFPLRLGIDDVPAALSRHGFSVSVWARIGGPGAHFGRLTAPLQGGPETWLVRAEVGGRRDGRAGGSPPRSEPVAWYYDSDHPWPGGPAAAACDDESRLFVTDVDRYERLARDARAPVLELGCGTGRVALWLARAGHSTVAVDGSAAMLRELRERLSREEARVRRRVRVVRADVTRLALPGRHDLALFAFNTLLLLGSLRRQRRALSSARACLARGGRLVIDVSNPTRLDLRGDDAPRALGTRLDRLGVPYVRYQRRGPMDAGQRVTVAGWYERSGQPGREPFSFTVRLLWSDELRRLLEEAGFRVDSLEGGHLGELWARDAPRMFVTATAR